MKTRNEVIQSFMERHCSLLIDAAPSAYTAILLQIEGIWKNGVAHGDKTGYDRGFDAARCTVEADKNIAYQQGYEDAQKETNPAVAYDKGLEDAWDAAGKIIHAGITPEDMSYYELLSLFGTDIKANIFAEFPPDEVVEKIRTYEEKQKAEVTNIATNADKFRQVFGYMPEVFNAVKGTGLDTWWDEPYKEPNDGMA